MDIATIGFGAETSALDVALKKLNALGPAAAGVQNATNKMASAVEGASASISSSASKVAKVEALQADAIFRRLKISETATKEQVAAANAARLKAQENLKLITTEERLAAAINGTAAAQKRVGFSSVSSVMAARPNTGPSLAVNNGPSVPPRDSRPNKFNTANIAAQFQDIGVTAAMGMNPLTIALQQGTQLAAIMNSMQSPVAGLAAAFKQVFNAVSLGTIAIIALVAGLIQMVDWTKVAQGLLVGFANVLVTITPYILAVGAALALFYSEAIIMGIVSLTVGMVSLAGAALQAGLTIAGAWLLALSPLQIIILGVLAFGAIFAAMGGNVMNVIRNIVGGLTGAYQAIMATWKLFPAAIGDLVIQAANGVLKSIGDMINKAVEMMNKLLPESKKISWKADLQIENPLEGKAAATGKIMGEAFDKGFSEGSNAVGNAISAAKNAAAAAAKAMKSYASTIGQEKEKKSRGKTDEEKYQDILNGADRKIASLKAERDAIGMTEFATAKLKYETELLSDAQQKNIELTEAGRAELMGRAYDMAVLETQTKNMREALAFAKDVSKGFFDDMKSGLQQGKTLWESFGGAVINVLNKIADKLEEQAFNALFSSGSSGTGGGLGALGSLFSGGFNNSGQSGLPWQSFGSVNPSGGLYTGFAKGGAFTNSIVSKPTPFQFASGGALGEMGEAGPEAIMPLHRGPDGSLGVKMAGNDKNAGGVVINIINNGDSKISTQQRQNQNGMEIDVMIDQVVAQKISDQSSASNRSLATRDSRRLISR
jgi:hypothetical protein